MANFSVVRDGDRVAMACPEFWDGGYIMRREDAIELRDLLLKEFPLEPPIPQERADWINRSEQSILDIEHKARRERIATAALQGIIAASSDGTHRDFAVDAVNFAQALIDVLDEEKPS